MDRNQQFLKACTNNSKLAKKLYLKSKNKFLNPFFKLSLESLRKGFFRACDYNQLEIVQFLLENVEDTSNINCRDFFLDSFPIHVACEQNNLEIIKLLIKNDPSHINIPNTIYTPLFYAIKHQYYDMVEYFLTSEDTKEKLNLNYTILDNMDALQLACFNSNEKIATLILKHMPEEAFKDIEKLNRTFFFAATNKYYEIIQLLIVKKDFQILPETINTIKNSNNIEVIDFINSFSLYNKLEKSIDNNSVVSKKRKI